MKTVQILGPNVAVEGMFSARERSSLNDGQFLLIRDFRADDGLLKVRLGQLSIISKPSWATSSVPLGATACTLNGNVYIVAIWSDGSKARVAVCPSTLDRWVEVTSSASWTGPSGNNRLTNIVNQVKFAVIKTQRNATSSGVFASRDALLIQNGDDYPRIWDPDTNDQASALTVTAVANNGGKFQLTIGSHNLVTGDHVWIPSIGGLPQLTGLWQITKVSGTQISLDSSTFAAGFTSGGSVYDRADLIVHKPVVSPGTTGTSIATMSSYWQVAGTGKTYVGTTGVVNQARYNLLDSTTGVYLTSNAVITWTATTAATAGDIATGRFSAPLSVGKQVLFLFEGVNAVAMLQQSKLEFNPDNVAYGSISSPWVTVYDPASSDVTKNSYLSITQDSTNNRVWVVFDTSQINGSVAYQLRFTRTGTAPGANQATQILFIGSSSQAIPSNSEWQFSFEDEYNKVETRVYTMIASASSINLIGGPAIVTSGSTTTQAPPIPLVSTVFSDFKYSVPNATGSSPITGGLDGQPERVNIYIDLPGPDGLPTGTFYFAFIATLYNDVYSAGVRAWQKSDTTNTTLTLSLSNYDIAVINFNRESPSVFQIPIPIANACLFAHNRLFTGGVKDDSSQFGLGDIYFSWERNPFRNQQIQEDELRGGYVQISDERVQAFVASGSAALGAGRVYLFTDKTLYSLGDSGPFATAGFSASDLSRPVAYGPHGTQSPLSIAQGYNAMYWLDQDMQLMRLAPDGLINFGKYKINDRLEMSLASRKANFCGAFRNDRYYLGYTISTDTKNSRVLVINSRMNAVESEDYPGKNFETCFVMGASTSLLSRLFSFNTDGTMYAYEENSIDDSGTAISPNFATGGITLNGWNYFYVRRCQAMTTSASGKSLNIARVGRRLGPSFSWSTTMSVDNGGTAFAIFQDTPTHTEPSPSQGPERDWEWYLDVSGSLPPNFQFIRFECTVEEGGSQTGVR